MIAAKICGLTRVEDALLVVELGAAAIGFVFYSKSPRYIEASAAARISAQLPSHIARVGVFVNPDLEFLSFTARSAQLTHLQLHGEENPLLCRQATLPVIKTVRHTTELNKYGDASVAAFLVDSKTPNQFGGTGQRADWSFCRQVRKQAPVILAGGLSAQNIATAIKSTAPDAVDLSSSVESSPGVKDHQKLREFFNALKNVRTIQAKSGLGSTIFKISENLTAQI